MGGGVKEKKVRASRCIYNEHGGIGGSDCVLEGTVTKSQNISNQLKKDALPWGKRVVCRFVIEYTLYPSFNRYLL